MYELRVTQRWHNALSLFVGSYLQRNILTELLIHCVDSLKTQGHINRATPVNSFVSCFL